MGVQITHGKGQLKGELSGEDIADFEVLRDDAMATILWLSYMGYTLAPLGEYDRACSAVHVRRRCGLMSNYFDHLFLYLAWQYLIYML